MFNNAVQPERDALNRAWYGSIGSRLCQSLQHSHEADTALPKGQMPVTNGGSAAAMVRCGLTLVSIMLMPQSMTTAIMAS